DHAIPVGLIVNELVSNAMKHAYPGERVGTVRVGLVAEGDGGYRLTVADDGIGLPEGFDIEGAESMGMVLVNTLVDQLDGTIEVKVSGGSRFTVRFRGGRKV
ncbi:MAG: ATP-binding protein, partial [Thermoplasmata archaeon]|nr:ATP-binding protein [Thermoplasmata archaeon]